MQSSCRLLNALRHAIQVRIARHEAASDQTIAELAEPREARAELAQQRVELIGRRWIHGWTVWRASSIGAALGG
jgi:hypothetical protein